MLYEKRFDFVSLLNSAIAMTNPLSLRNLLRGRNRVHSELDTFSFIITWRWKLVLFLSPFQEYLVQDLPSIRVASTSVDERCDSNEVAKKAWRKIVGNRATPQYSGLEAVPSWLT